jgi:hypothetical protein
MSDDQVTVATFLTPAEAEVVCTRLEEEGIPSIILGDGGTAAFPGVSDYEQGIRLRVAVENADRARTILDTVRQEALAEAKATGLPLTPAGRPGWVCDRCQAVVEIDMEVCPSCGRPMDPSLPEQSPTARALATAEEAETPEEKQQLQTWTGDKIAARALRTVVAGLLLCWVFVGLGALVALLIGWLLGVIFGPLVGPAPFAAFLLVLIGVLISALPWLYAASLLWRLSSKEFRLSSKGKTQATVATLVTLPILAGLAFIIPLPLGQPIASCFLAFLVVGLGVMVLRDVRRAPGDDQPQ